MSSSESTNLIQDVEPAKTDTYFASPELSQRADLLRHLTENSNLIPLIKGVEGMGKTTFIQHLLELAPENWIPVEICADVMLQPDALLTNLAGLFDQDVTSERLMDDLSSYFDDLRQDGFLPVIIVDDAHLLPEASIITLLRLHERSTDGAPLAQVLLFAEPEIDDLLKAPQLRGINMQSLQLLDMPELTLEQTELFLEHLLSVEESAFIRTLSADQIEQIYDESGGSPGLIKEYVLELVESSRPTAATFNPMDYFSTKSMIGVGLAFIVVIAILFYQDDINALFSDEEETIATPAQRQVLNKGSVPLTLPEPKDMAALDREMANEPPEVEAVQGDMEVVAGQEQDLGPVAATKESKKVVKPQKSALPERDTVKPEAEPAVSPSPEEVSPPEKESTMADNSRATPEKKDVVASASIEKKKDTQVKPASSKKVVQQGQPKKEEAKVSKPAAMATPAKREEQQKVEPVKKEAKVQVKQVKKPVKAKEKATAVKSVAKAATPEIKQPPKTTEVKLAPTENKNLPRPAPVEDMSTALVKDEVHTVKVTQNPPANQSNKPSPATTGPGRKSARTGASGFLREGWLLKQKPASYTIQIAGFRDENGIAGFIRRHAVHGPVAYYRTQRKGKPWFPVLYGVYVTRRQAIAAKRNLPKSIEKTGAWVRTIGSVQKDIRAR